MIFVGRKHMNVLIGMVLSLFLLISFLGVAQTDMVMGSDSQMSSNCPFMLGMASLCRMNPLEHITAWQSMFTAIPNQQDVLTILLLLLASFAISVFLIRRSTYPPTTSEAKAQFLYSRTQTPQVSLLQELFSSGILHPKIF